MNGYMLYVSYKNLVVEFPLYAENDQHLTLNLLKMGINGALDLSVWDNTWIIEENKWFTINIHEVINGKGVVREVPDTVLKDEGLILVKEKNGNDRFTLFCVENTQDFTSYTKYMLPYDDVNNTLIPSTITVGTDASCDIRVMNKMISARHAEIRIDNNSNSNAAIKVIDLGSKHGTVINSRKLAQKEEAVFASLDTLFLYGVKIIRLGNMIAINRPNKTMTNLARVTSLNASDSTVYTPEDDIFSRAPRLMQPLDTEEITIENPPAKKEEDETPWIFSVGPSLTMPIPMMTSMFLNMSINNRSPLSFLPMMTSMILSASMALVWNQARKKWKKQKDAADEEFRVEQYNKYIEQNRGLIEEKIEFNRGILNSQYLHTYDLLLCLNKNRALIWNRNLNHADFLKVCIGTGTMKNVNNIKVAGVKFSLRQDELEELPQKIHDEYEYIANIPAIIPLHEPDNHILGIIGDYVTTQDIARTIVLQAVALHSYLDVKLCVLYGEDESSMWDWVKWLPHTFVDDKKMRLVGNTQDSRDRVIQYLMSDLNNRKGVVESKCSTSGVVPKGLFPHHYIVVLTSDRILEGNQLGSFITCDLDLGVTFILAYSNMNGLPNECKALIECTDSFSGYYRLDRQRDKDAEITFDTVPLNMALWFARRISGFTIKEVANGEIPGSIDYLSMLGIGKLEQWNLEKKYRENRAYNSIKALLGLGSSGKEIYLDLHEKRHGPHGLVAGTTGSGKSETLQTAILSWLMNYSPEEVAFILIDYKGGGMANLFKGVPHVAGTITNISDDEETKVEGEEEEEEGGESLDNSQTRRALIAIKAEIKYRQGLFKAAKVNHIDAYMKMYRKGEVSSPLPHLIMISDEFAELKKEQPEFIKELVSAARVGRSLGIHLILATQKPSNSVDDEIWANSRFKICLRVQDTADSNSMLKRPEAAFITKTGRGLFQLGNNEIFEEFQSGWSGADYVPKDKIELAEDNICKMIEIDGTDTPIEVERKVRSDDTITQLDACVNFIIDKTMQMGIMPARQLWPPQLTKKMYLEDLIDNYKIDWQSGRWCFLGLVDEPEKQRQFPATVNLATSTHLLIVGSAGTGKTTLLQTLIYSMMLKYTPEQLNFYFIDFSSNALKKFSKTRFCGGFISGEEDLEKTQRLVQLLNRIIDERRILFDDANVTTYTEYCRKQTLPLVCVVIDGYAGFIEAYDPNHGDLFNSLVAITRDCSKYGIQFIVTSQKSSSMRSKLRQNFLNGICLNLPERTEYREILGLMPEFLPPKYKGRGLWLNGKKALEYHTALPIKGATEAIRTENLINAINVIIENNKGFKRATPIPVIPKDETYKQFFANSYIDDINIPIGYDITTIERQYLNLHDLVYIPLSDANVENLDMNKLLDNIVYALRNMSIDYTVIKGNSSVKMRRSLLDPKHSVVASDTKTLYNAFREIEKECIARSKEKAALTKENPDLDYIQYIIDNKRLKVVVMDSLSIWDDITKNGDFSKVEEEYKNSVVKFYNFGGENGAAATMYKRAKEVGIIWIVGVPTETVGTSTRATIGKNLVSTNTGVHLGGYGNNIKTFKYTGKASEGNKPLPENQAYLCKRGVTNTIHIPFGID